MRILVGVLSVSALINLALAQPAPSDAKIKIHQLIIEAKNLPDDDKERVVHLLQQNTYFENELETRVQMSLRDLGYFKAQVDDPKISIIGQSQETKDADVSVKVEQGAQYRLGEISFPHANVFPHDQMRSLFHLQSGDLFVSTAISLGLDRLRNLYATRGYINAVASPAVRADESSHTIDLIIDVDGGKPYDFGRLFLNGTEPHPGAGKALMESWKTLQGKQFNPDQLKTWLAANASLWPGAEVSHWDLIVQQPPSEAVDVKLLLP
jgi:outer membrane protein assembly factor BamA